MAITKEDIIKALEGMKLTELNDLVKAIEEHFGVSAAAPVSVIQQEDEGKSKASSEVNVILTDPGTSKVAVIKLIGEITNKGLMDAKKLVDKLPAVIKEKVKPEEADDIVKRLSEAGATVKTE